jgi:hypothetical protein
MHRPESRSRIPLPRREDLGTEGQKIFDYLAGAPLKMLAAENDTTLKALAVEAFNDPVKKRPSESLSKITARLVRVRLTLLDGAK